MKKSISFEDLIAPITPQEFRLRYKGKRPFVARAPTAYRKKFFSDSISWRRINDYMNNPRGTHGLQMIVPDENGPNGRNKLCSEKGMLEFDAPRTDWNFFKKETMRPWYDIAKIHKLWQGDSSMIITKASQMTRGLNAIAESIEDGYEALGEKRSVDSHLYCSSKKDAYSFECHADNDDNFLVHMIGSVRWTVYATFNKDLGRNTATVEQEKDMIPVIEEVLYPGDLLYIPRGLFHKAEANSPRVSVSFPVATRQNRMTRDFYDFTPNRNLRAKDGQRL